MKAINIPSTYTLLARSNRSKFIGVITQSKYLAIGSLVHFFNAKTGLVVVQGKPGENIATDIFNAYQHNNSSQDAIKEVEKSDEWTDYRQIAFLPFSGKGSVFTGKKLKKNKNEIVKSNCISIGNFLTSKNVINSIIEEFENTVKNENFSIALLNGLKMGLKRGGEKRGQQSAAIKIWEKHGSDYLKVMDLRVDDSDHAVEDLEKLIEKYYLYITPGNSNTSIENSNEVHKSIEKILKNASIKYSNLEEKINLQNLYRIENLENKWISEYSLDKDAYIFLRNKFLK